jgi:hypothetical protein
MAEQAKEANMLSRHIATETLNTLAAKAMDTVATKAVDMVAAENMVEAMLNDSRSRSRGSGFGKAQGSFLKLAHLPA